MDTKNEILGGAIHAKGRKNWCEMNCAFSEKVSTPVLLKKIGKTKENISRHNQYKLVSSTLIRYSYRTSDDRVRWFLYVYSNTHTRNNLFFWKSSHFKRHVAMENTCWNSTATCMCVTHINPNLCQSESVLCLVVLIILNNIAMWPSRNFALTRKKQIHGWLEMH
jgi:hypothetical protein